MEEEKMAYHDASMLLTYSKNEEESFYDDSNV
jgi:hypothetical protein